jgi:hypothetical protein
MKIAIMHLLVPQKDTDQQKALDLSMFGSSQFLRNWFLETYMPQTRSIFIPVPRI